MVGFDAWNVFVWTFEGSKQIGETLDLFRKQLLDLFVLNILNIFEGVCLTTVILTTGACGREALSSTCWHHFRWLWWQIPQSSFLLTIL